MVNLNIKIKIANTLATAILITSQCFRINYWLLDSTTEVTTQKFVLALIGLLQFLLVGFTIYQYLPKAPKDVYEGIKYWYLVIALLDGTVSSLVLSKLTLFAFGALLWQLAVFLFLYHRLNDYPPRNHVDYTFVNLPFSIYTSYTFLVALNLLFKLFIPSRFEEIAQVLFIIGAGFISLYLVDYSHRQDWAYALTTAWVLLGTAPFFPTAYTVSLITVGILVSAIARALIPQVMNEAYRRFGYWSHSFGERTPLL
ncbi:hypothetical protein BDB01DRAFT_847624 [Pilobolus umbonatus]|nr:hypothetical protein BDB01DRAFT_847624 [Pilobolus umbonatus]